MVEARPVVGSSQDSRLAFRESHLNLLLPVLSSIREQGSKLTISERLRAIRLASDMSLTLTASGVSWSRALGQDLSLKLRDNNWSGIESYPVETRIVPRKLSPCTFAKRAEVISSKRKSSGAMIANRGGKVPSSVFHSRVGRYRSLVTAFKRRRALKRYQQSNHATYLKELRRLVPLTALTKKSRSKTIEDCTSERQIRRLRKVIPGGCAMDAPLLLEETADYIVSLQMQVEALESIAEACNSS